MRANLSHYFDGVALKALSAVEIDSTRSNQHEFQATASMREFLGSPSDPIQYSATFLYFSDDEVNNKVETSILTLYNARKNNPKRAAEYRLYFRNNDATSAAHAGDLLAICQKPTREIVVLLVKAGSLVEHQVRLLFGQKASWDSTKFSVSTSRQLQQESVNLPEKLILDLFGVGTDLTDEFDIPADLILDTFPVMPLGQELSVFSRKHAQIELPELGPDQALANWLEIEHANFQILEHREIEKRIQTGFFGDDNMVDTEGFLRFSISMINRRRSRAGKSLEYHLEHIFREYNVLHTYQGFTEGRSQPDFIFPGIPQYGDSNFPTSELTFLGAERTLKDRWRQVLKEAERIPFKHLVTVDVGLTKPQVDNIAAAQIQLIVPTPIADLYPEETTESFISLDQFLALVTEKQSKWL